MTNDALYIWQKTSYSLQYWSNFDFNILSHINTIRKRGRGSNDSYNDVIIMADTETSKSGFNATMRLKDGTIKYIPVNNYVVVWTISIRAYDTNIVTLYGRTPTEFCDCVEKMLYHMHGQKTIMFFHNLAYDWVFLRKFLFDKFARPCKQLNTKSHYPINIEFLNGLILRDSLILAQRSLGKWAKDLNAPHQKAVGNWNYDLIRNQSTMLNINELQYAENDTLCGVECINILMKSLNKDITSMPYTATGIPREAVRKLAMADRFKSKFDRIALSYEQYIKMLKVYHGGYTHANRHCIDWVYNCVRCYDFASSYPYSMLAFKFPMGKFVPISDISYTDILDMTDDNAFMFKLTLVKPRLKSDENGMPTLQHSKCTYTIDEIVDNGRILCAGLVEIYLNEIDLEVLVNDYDAEMWLVSECEVATKDYLPRWFTDYVFECFTAKTMLKGKDPVAYALAKAKVNSLYGMTVQQSIKEELQEDYDTGEYKVNPRDMEEEYRKYLNRKTSILPYQWGVWVTSYSFRSLHQFADRCISGIHLYSDTDSCYATEWNEIEVERYNEECKKRLKANGYGAVINNGREYWLGVAETHPTDDYYTEFKVQGAKRYCGRCSSDNELHITVAGVPKKYGAKCLNDDINNFTSGVIFDGVTTGKKTHTYLYVDDIFTDSNGNEVGDSIDLTPCDYKLDSVDEVDWERLFEEEIEVQVYE